MKFLKQYPLLRYEIKKQAHPSMIIPILAFVGLAILFINLMGQKEKEIEKNIQEKKEVVLNEFEENIVLSQYFDLAKRKIFSGKTNLTQLIIAKTKTQGEEFQKRSLPDIFDYEILLDSENSLEKSSEENGDYQIIYDLREYPNIKIVTNSIVAEVVYLFVGKDIISSEVDNYISKKIDKEVIDSIYNFKDNSITKSTTVDPSYFQTVVFSTFNFFLFLFLIIGILRVLLVSGNVYREFSIAQSRDSIRSFLSLYSRNRFLLEKTIGTTIGVTLQLFFLMLIFYIFRYGVWHQISLPENFFTKTRLLTILVSVITLLVCLVTFSYMSILSALVRNNLSIKWEILVKIAVRLLGLLKLVTIIGLILSFGVILANDPVSRPWFYGASYIPFFDDFRHVVLLAIGEFDWIIFSKFLVFHLFFNLILFWLCSKVFIRAYQK